MVADLEKALRENVHFRALPQESLRRLSETARSISLERGQYLFSRGDPADAVYLLVSGDISIETISDQGRVVRMATLRPGEVFGEIAALDGAGRTADARALAQSALLRFPAAQYVAFLESTPAFARAVISDLARKLRDTNAQIEAISFQTLRERIASLLLSVSEGEESPVIAITQSEIADRLSATREKVNMHLRALQKDGAIALARGRIEIVDTQKLADASGGATE